MFNLKDDVFDILAQFSRRYTVCHKQDQDVIDIVKPNLEHGPWIAGGAVLCWLNREPVRQHDIDIFVRDQEQFDQVSNRLRQQSFYLVHNTDNALTLHRDSGAEHKVQVIKLFFDSVEGLLQRFDFTVCAVATDGNKIHAVPDFHNDFKNKVLRLQGTLKADALKRIVKYSVYGYTPTYELLDAVYAKKDLSINFEHDQYTFTFTL